MNFLSIFMVAWNWTQSFQKLTALEYNNARIYLMGVTACVQA